MLKDVLRPSGSTVRFEARLGDLVLGQKQLTNFKVDTKANPSDDPTRGCH